MGVTGRRQGGGVVRRGECAAERDREGFIRSGGRLLFVVCLRAVDVSEQVAVE